MNESQSHVLHLRFWAVRLRVSDLWVVVIGPLKTLDPELCIARRSYLNLRPKIAKAKTLMPTRALDEDAKLRPKDSNLMFCGLRVYTLTFNHTAIHWIFVCQILMLYIY